MKIRLIITAGGMSRRLPPNKLLIKTGTATHLENTVKNFLDFGLEIVLVTGHDSEKTGILLSDKFGSKIKIVKNDDYKSGLAGSIKAGLNAFPGDPDYYGFCLGDKPFIQRKTIEYILGHLTQNKPEIIVPVYAGQNGHPAFFSKNYKKEIMHLKDNMGARQIIQNQSDRVNFLPVSDRGIILDLDLFYKELNES